MRVLHVVGRKTVTAPVARVRTLRVGDVTVEEMDVGVLDVMPHVREIAGLLGADDFLQHFKMAIDGRDQRLLLEVLTPVPAR